MSDNDWLKTNVRIPDYGMPPGPHSGGGRVIDQCAGPTPAATSCGLCGDKIATPDQAAKAAAYDALVSRLNNLVETARKQEPLKIHPGHIEQAISATAPKAGGK